MGYLHIRIENFGSCVFFHLDKAFFYLNEKMCRDTVGVVCYSFPFFTSQAEQLSTVLHSIKTTMGWQQLLLCILALAGAICCASSSTSRKDPSSCGYELDGINDYASFSIGGRNTKKIANMGFTMMFWLRNKHKDKNGHFEQCLMSHSTDDHGRYVSS